MFRRLASLPLHAKIFVAIGAGAACGQLTRLGVGAPGFGFERLGSIAVADVYSFVGGLFLSLLQMVVVPLIASAVINGVAGIASGPGFARMGLKTLAYYFTTTALAVLAGLVLVNILRPGANFAGGGGNSFGLGTGAEGVERALGGKGAGDIVGVFERMIPSNIFETASQNSQMLGLIFFAIVFGFALARIDGSTAAPVRGFFEGLYAVMLKITDGVMLVAPLGIFGLVASVSAKTAPAAAAGLLVFFACVAGGLVFHSLVILPILLRLFGGISPVAHIRAMLPALLTAFSTSSSSATLPVTVECLEKNAGVGRRTTGFVVPLGATINMDGTALYECVAVLFIAQVYGVELGFSGQFVVAILALLTSVGVAGVPSASLVAIVVILGALGLPLEAIGLLMVFDRLLDMMRTAVNVFSDSCGAAIIAKSEGDGPDYGAA